MATIDLDDVLDGLTRAVKTCVELNGKVIEDNDSVRSNRQEVAVVSRDLLHLADLLDAMSALAKNEYWTIKGKESYL